MPLLRIRDDTIVAVATATGRGAVAIVRTSGSEAEQICRRVVAPWRGWPLRPRTATRARIHRRDEPESLIDYGLVTMFPAPHSYTGETVIELGVHGGEFVPHAVFGALLQAGARAAVAGEFTERAVLNGKLDLLRAEAIADLIDARTIASHRMAIRQLSGALSDRLAALRDALIEVQALLAYEVDFPEEDSGLLPRARIHGACERVISQLDVLLATSSVAILGRDGATVVLAGPQNAGKSSLLNALIGEARVIVSDQPGTTRDAVEVLLEQEPWPLRLVDTAGLGDTADPVERLGIEVSERYLSRAHVVLACAESSAKLEQITASIRMKTSAPLIQVLTKCDLPANVHTEASATSGLVRVSALKNEGLDELLARVSSTVVREMGTTDPDAPTITRARHRAALLVARQEVTAFLQASTEGLLPVPVAAVHIRSAGTALDELIGSVDIDAVFARVFSTFCIGK